MSILVLGIVQGIVVMKIGKYLVGGDVWADVYFLPLPKGNVGVLPSMGLVEFLVQ